MTLGELAQERYVSLTTFKRDGTPVPTPVWVVGDDGRLLVHSAADTWKVKRIRRDDHVRVAPCGPGGKVHGDPVDGRATILPDTSLVQELEARKYGFMYRLVRLVTALTRTVKRQRTPESVTIAITPAPPGPLDR